MIDFDEPLCQPYWADPVDKGCIGFKSGIHVRPKSTAPYSRRSSLPSSQRWEARLWDIGEKDSWLDMCATTPNTINSHHFTTPTHCDGGKSWWYVASSSCMGFCVLCMIIVGEGLLISLSVVHCLVVGIEGTRDEWARVT